MTLQNNTGRICTTMDYFLNNVNGLSVTATSYTNLSSLRLLFDAVNDFNPGIKYKLVVIWKNSGTNTNSLILRDEISSANISASETSQTFSSANTEVVTESDYFTLSNSGIRRYGLHSKVDAGTGTIESISLKVYHYGSKNGQVLIFTCPQLNASTSSTNYLTRNWTDTLINIDKFPSRTKVRLTVFWKSSVQGTLYVRLFDQFGATGYGELAVVPTSSNTYQIDRGDFFDLPAGLTSYMFQFKTNTGTISIANLMIEVVLT